MDGTSEGTNHTPGESKQDIFAKTRISKLEKMKFLNEAAKIVEKCLSKANNLCMINKESLFASLLSSWYMKHKLNESIFKGEKYLEFET